MFRKIAIVILIILGAGILAYPTFAQWYAARVSVRAIDDLEQAGARLSEQRRLEEFARAITYNENLSGQRITDPFVPGSGAVLPQEYRTILDVDGTGAMGTLEIPRIKVYLPIYHGVWEDALQQGIGHIPTTALPVGGEGTHCVLVGHRALATKRLFTDLDQMQLGDKFYISVLGHNLAYEVDRIDTVLPDQTEGLQPVVGKDYVTLVTCTPYGVNSHRLLVRGKRIPYDRDEEISDNLTSLTDYLVYLVAALAVLIVLFIIWIVRRRRNA
jgi:sortase A